MPWRVFLRECSRGGRGFQATRQLLYWRFNPASSTRVIQGAEAWIEALACTDPPAPEIPELFSAGMDRKIKKVRLGQCRAF